ncbi:MAG: glycosyltransferase [Planctomycetota bacterium]|jgi:spore maturation protein CgeB
MLREESYEIETTTPGDASLVILGERGEQHLGTHFQEAASALGITSSLLDAGRAVGHPFVYRIWWRLFRSLPRSGRYSRWVVEECRRLRPSLVLAVGRVPLRAQGLEALRRTGTVTANFATDDPWNPMYRKRWLLESMAAYDWIFTPRRRNIEQFKNLGVRNVEYMPFGYSPALHERSTTLSEDDATSEGADVLYVGGCDTDRIPYLQALNAAGFSMCIYGGRWERVPDLKAWVRGIGGMREIQDAVQSSKVTLVLPRHANRDGHVMRTFETAAAGGCMLVEDTPEHRQLLGSEPVRVSFFQGLDDLVTQVRRLVGDAALRQRLRDALQDHIVRGGQNRYQDRLASIWKNTVGRVPL